MSAFKDYFSAHANDYRTFRPIYPQSLFRWLQSRAGKKATVWECGAGNGQATQSLAPLFKEIYATDASQEQLNQAPEFDNVTYQAVPAEDFEAPNESFDLVVVAQAIHWFDHPRFFAKVQQLLKPGGFLAVWGYQFINIDPTIDPIIKRLHSEILEEFWPKERALLNEGYQGIDFPYPSVDEVPEFIMEAMWTFPQLIGYLNTWSATKQYEQSKGENPLELIFDELQTAWGDPDQSKHVSWPLIVYVGKKRKSS